MRACGASPLVRSFNRSWGSFDVLTARLVFLFATSIRSGNSCAIMSRSFSGGAAPAAILLLRCGTDAGLAGASGYFTSDRNSCIVVLDLLVAHEAGRWRPGIHFGLTIVQRVAE